MDWGGRIFSGILLLVIGGIAGVVWQTVTKAAKCDEAQWTIDAIQAEMKTCQLVACNADYLLDRRTDARIQRQINCENKVKIDDR